MNQSAMEEPFLVPLKKLPVSGSIKNQILLKEHFYSLKNFCAMGKK